MPNTDIAYERTFLTLLQTMLLSILAGYETDPAKPSFDLHHEPTHDTTERLYNVTRTIERRLAQIATETQT